MSRDEIAQALDLDLGGQAEDAEVQLDHQAPVAPASPYAMKLDSWGKRRGEELASPDSMLHELGAKHVGSTIDFADFYGAAFEPEPMLEERCQDPARLDYLKRMMESAEYKELHRHTNMDDISSEIACASFAKEFYTLIESNSSPSELQQMRSAGKALKEAGKEVKDFKDACEGLGLGGDGGMGSSYDTKKAVEHYKKIRGSPELQAIFARIGRYKRFASALQRNKTIHGMDDVVGVTLGGDIAGCIPSELAKLAVPELELDLMRKLLEREAMVRAHQSTEKVGKGPIILTVDESGSMSGDKIADAKAIAMTVAYLAHQQKRWCCLIGFSGGTEGNVLVLKPGRWGEADILPWLEHFYSGGTTLDVPIYQMPAFYHAIGAPPGKTDLICITDAIVEVDEEMAGMFNSWKKEAQARMITLIIGERQAGDMSQISDEVHLVGSLSTEEEGVAQVLSI